MSDTRGLGADMPIIDRIVYTVCRTLIVIVGSVLFRVRVVGKENLPRSGPFVVAPVHRSNLDTPILGFLTGRRMRYMGKDSLWRKRPLARFLTALGGFPVVRGSADREALRACEAVLARGEPLVMFPEGTRKSGPVVAAVFDGPAFVAARQGVPIVPVGIGGSERVMGKGARLPRPKKIVLVVGKPIPPPSSGGRVPRREIAELSDRLRVGLQAAFDEADHRAGVR